MEIDLTLKLSPCGQNAEEKWLTIAEDKAKSNCCKRGTTGSICCMSGEVLLGGNRGRAESDEVWGLVDNEKSKNWEEIVAER
ncbi:putative ninja-family protein [Sesbania bispinosa]|nr:putative ninja-family protein [Sesbania bispinosa]